jgi:hypothetical protein
MERKTRYKCVLEPTKELHWLKQTDLIGEGGRMREFSVINYRKHSKEKELKRRAKNGKEK